MLNRDTLTPIYPASLSDCLIQTDPLSDARLTRLPLPGRLSSGRVTSAPLPKAQPTPKDGGTLRTVLDARAYMLRLSKDRKRSARWQRAAQLLLAKADVGAISRQLELALIYDGKLDGRWHEDQDAFHASPRYVGRYATSAKIYRNMAGGQLTLSQAHLEGGAWTNCFPYDLCQPALTSVAASLQL